MKNNQRGIASTAVIVLILVVALVGLVGWRISNNKSADKQPVAKQAPVVAEASEHKAPKGWKTYVDKHAAIYFDYPADWKIDIQKSNALKSDTRGDFVSGKVVSPSGKLSLDYSNFVVGVGDPGCGSGTDRPCPTVNITRVDPIGINNMVFVEKITYWQGVSDLYRPSFGLAANSKDLPIAVGERNNASDIFLFTNFNSDGGYFAYGWAPNASGDEGGYRTKAEAEAFLQSNEAKTAKRIILSVKQAKN